MRAVRSSQRAVPCAAVIAVLLWLAVARPLTAPARMPTGDQGSGCVLDPRHGAIQHLIYLQFDNTHLLRDDPNVPSDLEQMPHLLDFLQTQGVVLGNHHTPLIAHTATDFLTALTGLYPDNHGVPISNSYRTFTGENGASAAAVSFGYWTTPVSRADPAYTMLSASGSNVPAPWAPFARVGCNVGAVGMANTVLENAGADVATVFGANSPQAAAAKNDSKRAFGDLAGIAVHCAQGDAACATTQGGVPDLLPDEPGGYDGYNGYNALFGHQLVAPVISPNGPLVGLDGTTITNPDSHAPGFPGFDGLSPSVSLGYVAAMQEHHIPVTFAYIADAHGNHATGKPFGPGEAGYVAQLQQYDAAFAAFFDRLQADGIDSSNTLFVVTADEGDHFTGGPPTAACDGVTTPCGYSNIGEIAGNLTGLLVTQANVTTPFQVHADSAPTFYVDGDPAQDAPETRQLEQAVGSLHAADPLTGTDTGLTAYLADRAEMRLLHMVTADPLRTPTFTLFAKPQFYLSTGAADCAKPCVSENGNAAWDHGTLAPEITTTWLGMVGPGVRRLGRDDDVWSDHTDIRPTMLALLGLTDDYPHDGRALIEVMDGGALPPALAAARADFTDLAVAYKQIDAPVGDLALASLQASTAALESDSPGDATFGGFERAIAGITLRRNALTGRMRTLLDGAVFSDQPIDPVETRGLIAQAQALLQDTQTLTNS